jgi:hypothetical protein
MFHEIARQESRGERGAAGLRQAVVSAFVWALKFAGWIRFGFVCEGPLTSDSREW